MRKLICILAIFSLTPAHGQNYSYNRDTIFNLLAQSEKAVEKFKLWEDLSDSYSYSGKLDSSRFAIHKLFQIATHFHIDSLLARTYINLGGYFKNTDDYSQALEFLFKGLALSEKIKSKYDIYLAAKEAAVVFKQLKNYSEALKYMRKSEPFLKVSSMRFSGVLNRHYSHMAEIFLGLKLVDSALRYIQFAKDVTLKVTDPYGYSRILYIFAIVYRELGDFALAQSYYRKCMEFSDAENIALPYVNATTDYSDNLFKAALYNSAKEYALAGYVKAEESKNKLGIINAAALLRKVYKAMGQSDSAYYYADIKDIYRDSVFNEQKINQIQNITFAEQIKENEKQIRDFEEAEQRKRNIEYALLALGIITFIIVFLFLSRSHMAKTKIIQFLGVLALLLIFEFLNLLLHPFLEKITHHKPSLLLLALVCIAALLVPLHHRLEKWITHKLVEKNKQMRLAAANRRFDQLKKNNHNLIS